MSEYGQTRSNRIDTLRSDILADKENQLSFIVDDFINSCEKLNRNNRHSLLWSSGKINSYDVSRSFSLIEFSASKSILEDAKEDWQAMEKSWKEKANYYFVTEIYIHTALMSLTVFTAGFLFFVMIKVYGSAIGLRKIFAHLHKSEIDSLIENCKKFESEFLKDENERPTELKEEKSQDVDSEDNRDEGLFMESPNKEPLINKSPMEKQAKVQTNPINGEKEGALPRKTNRKTTKTTAAIEKIFGRSKEEAISMIKSLKKKGGATQGIKLDLETIRKKDPISKEVDLEIRNREDRLSDWGDYKYFNYVIRAIKCMALYFVPIGFSIYSNYYKGKEFEGLSNHLKSNYQIRSLIVSLRSIQFKHVATGFTTLSMEGNDLRAVYEEEIDDILTILSSANGSTFPNLLQDYAVLYKSAFSTSVCQSGLEAFLATLQVTVESRHILISMQRTPTPQIRDPDVDFEAFSIVSPTL